MPEVVTSRGALAMYFGPLAIGGIVLLFMVKPLFAPRRREKSPLTLDSQKEPLLFAFVEKLCAAVHAPAPREIQVDSEVNASASLRRGFWSLFGSDLTLTIGLPLAAGMSLRQLSGVLAHEFGHFSQGAGMRLTYIIRSISFWFVRVVYERDAWDEWLEKWSRNTSGGYNVGIQATRGCVWLTRRILWVLMWVGHVVSCFMLRQMEFDADRHEARLAGSETFQQTAQRLAELSVARQMAMGDLSQFLNEGRLADDLPALVLANVPQITPEIRKQSLEPRVDAKTGLFDTHPADRDRVASARLEKATGIFRLPGRAGSGTHPDAERRNASASLAAAAEPEHVSEDGDDLPATVLFHDFTQLSRDATRRFYEEQLEREIKPEELHSVESLVGSQAADLEAAKALERYFFGMARPLRPFPLPLELGPAPLKQDETVQALTRGRNRLLGLVDEYRAAFKEFDDADTDLMTACRAEAVYRAKADSFRKPLQLKFDDLMSAVAGAEAARGAMQAVERRLTAFESAAVERLCAALSLAQRPEPRASAGLPHDTPQRISELLLTAHLAASLGPYLVALRNQLSELSTLLACVRENEKNETLINAIRQGAVKLREGFASFRGRLAGKPYPFDHAQIGMTLDLYVCGSRVETELPDADSIGPIASLADEAIKTMFMLYHRSLSHLAAIADKIEEGLGLPPLAPTAAAEEPTGSTLADSSAAVAEIA